MYLFTFVQVLLHMLTYYSYIHTCISDLRSLPTDAERILWLLFPFNADSLRFLLGLDKSLLGVVVTPMEVDLSVFGLEK